MRVTEHPMIYGGLVLEGTVETPSLIPLGSQALGAEEGKDYYTCHPRVVGPEHPCLCRTTSHRNGISGLQGYPTHRPHFRTQ